MFSCKKQTDIKNLFKKSFGLQFHNFGCYPQKFYQLSLRLNIKNCLWLSPRNFEISPSKIFFSQVQYSILKGYYQKFESNLTFYTFLPLLSRLITKNNKIPYI